MTASRYIVLTHGFPALVLVCLFMLLALPLHAAEDTTQGTNPQDANQGSSQSTHQTDEPSSKNTFEDSDPLSVNDDSAGTIEPDDKNEEPTGDKPAPEAGKLRSREIGDAFKNFQPSEEISADNAVTFPVDI